MKIWNRPASVLLQTRGDPAITYLIDVLTGSITLVVVHDSLGCDARHGRDNVIVRQPFGLPLLNQLVGYRIAEDFASSSRIMGEFVLADSRAELTF